MEILDKDFVECSDARDVKYLIVGGYALAAHGHPRATKHLDVWALSARKTLSASSKPSQTSGWTRSALALRTFRTGHRHPTWIPTGSH